MPRGNRTGPEGLGPMTGRAFGYCAGNSRPGFAEGRGGGVAFGRGFGRGYGRAGYDGGGGFAYRGGGAPVRPGAGVGYGRSRGWYDEELAEADEKALLDEEITLAERRLAALRKARANRDGSPSETPDESPDSQGGQE